MAQTIAAIATGSQLSAIGILRLSGEGAVAAAEQVFTPANGRPMSQQREHSLIYGTLRDKEGRVIDQCLCTISRGPGSYTGEDTAELQCHGSPTVLREGLEALFAAGARQALPGEFTKRAFLNGRLELTQAEAVIDLIHAETAEAARNAAGQLGGAIARQSDGIYRQLMDISAHYHAVIDYPDEDIEDFRLADYRETLARAEATLERLEGSFAQGQLLREGVPAVILGRPNAGKSSLLNALLGYERAIVTDIPGTTRDTLTEKVKLGRTLLRLTDTAGLRETGDAVERLGVARAREAMAQARLALILVDPEDAGEDDRAILAAAQDVERVVLVYTKADIRPGGELAMNGLRCDRVLRLSARTGQGLEALAEAVEALFPPSDAPAGEILTNARQAEAVGRARLSIRAARQAMDAGLMPDAVLTETEGAMEALGELSGKTVREDITGRIFERFCVGK